MNNSFAPGELDPLADVALAWKSVQEAKAVLQRIENKFYHQTWSGAKSQAARRKLWHEKSFDGERNKDETALSEKKSTEIPPGCRKGSPAALTPSWTQICWTESPAGTSGSSRMIPLSLREASRSAPSSPARDWAVGGKGTAGTWTPAKNLDRPRRDNFWDQADPRGHTVQKEKPACSLHHPPHSPAGSRSFLAVPGGNWTNTPMPMALLPPTCHLPPASKASDQKLEELWTKSPQNKLEQLKKRIQEQKRKQQAAPREQKHLISAQEPMANRALKRKVCRVGSAPPAPAYRDQRGRSSAQRTQTQSQRLPPPKSSVLERPGAGKGAKLPGASAWREGQKLARKLLGPPPEFPNLRSRAEEQSTANTFEPGRGFETIPVMENSWRDKGRDPVGKSPEFQSWRAVGRGSNATTEDTNQALSTFHFQSHDGNRPTRLPKDTAKGKGSPGIVLQQFLGLHSPPPGLWGITPSAFCGERAQPSLMPEGAKPSTPGSCSRGKSASPQRLKGLSSPAQRASEKENLKHPSKRRVNLKNPHPYSPEIVREFMNRKKEERKRKLLKEKKSLVEAAEMRKKRLQEVYRKQKEAIGKKSCPDQMYKLIGKAAPAKGNPQCDLEHEQSSGGILGRSSMAWLDGTPCPLLHRDHTGRNQLPESAQSPKKGEALAPPEPLGCECCFLSEDLRECCPPALPSPPLRFSPPQDNAKPFSKDLISELSPYRSKQDRVKAIHSLSKELEEKIDMTTKRLSAESWVKDSADKTSTQTTLDLHNDSSSVPEPETSRDKLDRKMTAQMLLDVADPDVLCVSPSREFPGLDRVRLVGSTEGATALDRQQEMPTPLPGGSSERKEFPWIIHSTAQRHLSTGGDLSNTLQGFPVSKGSEVDINPWHGKPIASPASPAHRFLSGSPQRGLTAQGDHYPCRTILEVQNQEEKTNQSPEESLKIPDSLSFQPSAALSTRAETDGSEQALGGGDCSCTELKEKHRSHLDTLRQTSLLLAHKLQVHQLQQKQQLRVLREKAKQEVQESQRILRDLLQHSPEESRSSRGSDPSVPGLCHTGQTWRGHQLGGDQAAGSNLEIFSLRQPALKIERIHSPVDPKIVGERKPLGGKDLYCSVLQEASLPADPGEPLPNHQALDLLSPLVNLPCGEDSVESSGRASWDSQGSTVIPISGGSGVSCGLSLALAGQCLRAEELRARHQQTLLELRKEALRDKARAELAWLGHHRRVLENLQDSNGASAMAAKQSKILLELKKEQAEIQHLQNIYRAAHQERKLLLKQQREILMLQLSTAQLQKKLHNLPGKQELTRCPATEEAIKLKKMRLVSDPKSCSSSAESAAPPERPELAGSKDSCVQLKQKQEEKHQGFSTENKETQAQKQAEESPGLEQPLGLQGPGRCGMVAKRVCGATGGTTGSAFVVKDCKNSGLTAQDNVLLPVALANSSGLDEPTSTPIPREGRQCEFLETLLEDKALLSKTVVDPKDNEDINPCGSKFIGKGLWVLSTWCNLCLVQAENTPEGAVKEVEVPVPSEFHQVDHSQCLKHLDHVSHQAPKEELNLRALSEGLAATESSSKANNSSLKCESAKSDSSLPEFQKVSAVQIDTLESSISESESELKHGEDTDVGVPEEFVHDSGDVFPNLSKEVPVAVRDGKETSPTEQHEDDRAESSPCSQKYPGDVLDRGCAEHLLPFIPTDKAKPAHSSQSDSPAVGMDEQKEWVAKRNQSNPTTKRQAVKEGRTELTSSASSRKELFQAENCSSKGEDDATSIRDKGLPPSAEDALSEILSPVDEILSYGSADLPSTNKKDLSFLSEDLPPPPLGAGAVKSDDLPFSRDDFPAPPEQMTGSETSQGMDGDISLKMDALPPLPDNIMPEEFPLLNQETIDALSTQGSRLSEQSSLKAISSSKEDLSEHQQGEHETPLQHLELLPVSNPVSSGQAGKSPKFPMQQSKTHSMLPSTGGDSDDPLLPFEIGHRVFVRQTQPGTLMFKGLTHFGSGHWAGVALDKAEGDNAGTYQGVKYFGCAQHCGVFVRPEEVSHLLGENKNSSNYSGEEDSDSCDDESFKGGCKYSEDDEQREGFTEEKAEDPKSAGGSEIKENQSGLHTALLHEKEQKFPHSNQCKCNESLCQKSLMCLGSDKEKPEVTQIKQRILAAVLPMKGKTNNTDEVNTGKNICCLVEDQKRIKLADDIASELGKKLLFDILIAFSETAQHEYKSAFEKDTMNYSKGLRQGNNQKLFLLKENAVPVLSESSAKVSDVLLGDFDALCIHGCHTVAERIVTKFIDDAVKEYKKIKRKHGSKADKILNLSSETSPNTLPFLTKILDAAVFGSSEDFVQPNSDQHVLGRQRQKQYLYKLDQWHSAPWKKTVEVPLVIPHYSSYVKNLSACAVEELWTPENINSNFKTIGVPKCFEWNDLPGNDVEAESKRMYNQVIFDLTRELCAEHQVTANPGMFPWMKRNVGSCCSRCFCTRTDVSDVKVFIQGEIIKIMNLEKNDLEMKRKILNMTKYGNRKRDRVDLILVQELHKEESQWTYYGDDELTVKMRMTEGIFDTLILDTIRVLNKIYLRRASD
ncbi:coiled-coil domain-containing protein 187 isoform X3 [Pithys albifrons albifrons]|uniref:coiled-coil domain-containing protein 187 isoform X3 n=1 Tax=Pithys albifrons albifrons TaxID=3385563 RepID=UPI003A5CC6D4